MKQPYSGLTNKEVLERRKVGLYNKSAVAPTKTVGEIIRTNLITYFNMIFLIIAVLLMLVGAHGDLTFLPIVIANSLIGIFQELRAKHTLDKLRVLHTPVARAVRDYKEKIIPIEEIVLDDVMILRAGDQIPTDAKVLDGEIAVNEALLTGEPDEIVKHRGEELLSGSFVVYGECYAVATAVGEDAYAAQLTLKAKAIKTGEQSEIISSLNTFIKIAGVMIIPIGILMVGQQYLLGGVSIKMSVQAMVAAVIGMIPEGLFLLASVTLALSAMRLAKRNVMLHDMKSIETLARVDTLCVDKTGTITTDEMSVSETIWLGRDNDPKQELLEAMIAEVVSVQNADSATMAALKKQYKRKKNKYRLDDFADLVQVQGFSSRYKYSGVEFKKASFVIGAPTFVLGSEYQKYEKQIRKYTRRGMRVLVFARYFGKLNPDQPLTAKVEALALIVLKNEVRETAAATFGFFAEQGVEVKVISGDDMETVVEVAREAGIKNATKAVDVSNLKTQREFDKAVLENTIFARVNPAQKRRIIKVLKNAGRTVAMTGDGVNDVLALKDADCSVAMASGTQAAVQVSQIVLLTSDFATMPSVVQEGRRVVNNLERSGSLFLVKNIFSTIAAFLAICFAITYPMIPRQVSLVTLWTIGVPSFFLAQIPNEKLIRGKFLANVLTEAFPAALTNLVLIGVAVPIASAMGMPFEVRATLCTMIWAVVGVLNIARICRPFDKWKTLIFTFSAIGMVFCIMMMRDWFKINLELDWQAWLMLGIATVLVVPLFKLFGRVVDWFYDRVFLQKIEPWLQNHSRWWRKAKR